MADLSKQFGAADEQSAQEQGHIDEHSVHLGAEHAYVAPFQPKLTTLGVPANAETGHTPAWYHDVRAARAQAQAALQARDEQVGAQGWGDNGPPVIMG